MDSKQHARKIVEAISLLQEAGYGNARINCYIKEGLGAWRHQIFASEAFEKTKDKSTGLFSIPGNPIAAGDTAEEIANEIIKNYPQIMAAAKSPPTAYSLWLKEVLKDNPDGVFQMELPDAAFIGRKKIQPPF